MNSQYHKIQTVFKRDPETRYKTLLIGEWARPEFGYLADNEWLFTEKVDGTNVRVMWNGEKVRFGGKTDNAQLHVGLVERLRGLFPTDKMVDAFGRDYGVDNGAVCLYGEGFGAKIQKGGGLYRDHQDFILFDVKIGPWWLERPNVEDVAAKLDIAVVPIVQHGPLSGALHIAEVGFASEVAHTPREAEGLVMRPATELCGRDGKRIIAKIKSRDFAVRVVA